MKTIEVNKILKIHPEYSWFPNKNFEESIIQDYKLGSKYISNSQNDPQEIFRLQEKHGKAELMEWGFDKHIESMLFS